MRGKRLINFNLLPLLKTRLIPFHLLQPRSARRAAAPPTPPPTPIPRTPELAILLLFIRRKRGQFQTRPFRPLLNSCRHQIFSTSIFLSKNPKILPPPIRPPQLARYFRIDGQHLTMCPRPPQAPPLHPITPIPFPRPQLNSPRCIPLTNK